MNRWRISDAVFLQTAQLQEARRQEPAMAMDPVPPKHPSKELLHSVGGRFIAVIGFALLGLIGGLLYGAYQANEFLSGIPGHGKHVEPGTIEPETLIVWAVSLGTGAIGGILIGALTGAVWVIAKPSARD
jgi:hypothetical protein